MTAAKYWREWANPMLVFMVLNNGDLNQVTWEQRAMEGDPKFPGSQETGGFWLSLAVLVTASGGLYMVFRRRDWL